MKYKLQRLLNKEKPMSIKRIFTAVLVPSLLLTSLIFHGGAAASSTSTTTAYAPPTPVAESEIYSTAETRWGWYYNQTAEWINENGKKSNMRPFKLVPNGAIEYEPRYHVLFVRNEGAYRVDDWQV